MALNRSNCIFDTGHPVLLAIYTIVNIVLLISVISVIIKTIRKYLAEENPDKRPKLVLMIEGTIFNIVTALCLIWLLAMGLLKAQSDFVGSNLNPIYYWFHEIFVLFYGKQGCLLLLFLFTRLKLAFDKSIFKLRTSTSLFFNGLFLTSLLIFTYVPLFGTFKSNDKSFWVICSSSLCFFNLFTMSSMTLLFTFKLIKVYKQCAGSGKDNSMFIKLITKISFLGMISIIITATNCTLLIIRYSFKIDNFGLIMTSNLLIPIDIWTNWICVILSYAVFDKYYYKYCGKCDSMSQKFWYSILWAKSDEAKCVEMNNEYPSKSKSFVTSEVSILNVPKSVTNDGPPMHTMMKVTSHSNINLSVDTHARNVSTYSDLDIPIATITESVSFNVEDSEMTTNNLESSKL